MHPWLSFLLLVGGLAVGLPAQKAAVRSDGPKKPVAQARAHGAEKARRQELQSRPGKPPAKRPANKTSEGVSAALAKQLMAMSGKGGAKSPKRQRRVVPLAVESKLTQRAVKRFAASLGKVRKAPKSGGGGGRARSGGGRGGGRRRR